MNEYYKIINNYLKWAPYSLALREVSRINYLNLIDDKYKIKNSKRILDVGCGDGRWWNSFMPDHLNRVYGVDISKKEVELASNLIQAKCVDVSTPGFTNCFGNYKFDLIIGNCSLEHVINLDLALVNIFNSLEEDGFFILIVPTPTWALKGNLLNLFNRISPRFAMSVSGLFNGFFQHWHLYGENIWRLILSNVGFKVDAIYGLGNPRSDFLFRLGLPTSLISFLVKSIFGKYLNAYLSFLLPNFLKKYIINSIITSLDPELHKGDNQNAFEYIIVCKK